jgi:hypothetical protein
MRKELVVVLLAIGVARCGTTIGKCVTAAEAAGGYNVQPAPNVVIERRER